MPAPQISTFDQLRSFITTNFPDNNSGLVDPEDVRVALRSFVDIQSLRNDLMTANLSPDQAAVWQELISKLDQIQRESKSGITGTATQTNAPTPGAEFETWKVTAPITSPNSWGNIAVTQAELDANYVFFDVKNGVVTKDLSLKPSAPLSTVLNPFGTTSATSEKAVADYVNSQFQTIGTKTGNLIYYKDFKANSYSVNGSNKLIVANSNNWIGIKVEGNFVTGEKYFLQGEGSSAMSSSTGVVYFTDENDNFISKIVKSDYTGVLTIPAGTKRIYISVASGTNIGINPTESIYKNTLQLKKGESFTTFEKYGFVLDFPLPSTEITKKDFTKYTSDGAVLDLFNKIAVSSYNLLNYLNFEAGTYIKNGSNKMVLVASVNQLCVKVKVEPNTTYFLQGTAPFTGTVPLVTFGDNADNYISEIQASAFTGIVSTPINCEYLYIRIANAVGIATDPTNTIYNNVVQLSKGNTLKPFQPFGVLYVKESVLPSNETNPQFFVKLTPVTATYTGARQELEVAVVYEKLGGNVYAKHVLKYQFQEYADYSTPNDFVGGKIVRYFNTIISNYNPSNNTFSDTTTVLTTAGENEFVLNSGSWSGGYHGNENFINCFFLIDGKPYNVNGQMDFTPMDLKACNSFAYTMSSKIKLHSDKSDLFDRLKVVKFENGGYKVRTKLKGLQVAPSYMYTGICCVSKTLNKVISDSGYSYTPMGSTNFLINADKMMRELFYSGNDFSLSVSSAIIDDSTIDKNAGVMLWDRASDTKYYRRIESYDIAVGSFLEFEQTVKIKKIQL